MWRRSSEKREARHARRRARAAERAADKEAEHAAKAEERRHKALERYGDGAWDVLLGAVEGSEIQVVHFLVIELGFTISEAKDAIARVRKRAERVVLIDGVSREGADRMAAELQVFGAIVVPVRTRALSKSAKRLVESIEPGRYSVELTAADEDDEALAVLIGALRDDPEDVVPLIERARHIGPEVIVEGVSDSFAIQLKRLVEERGGKVRIREKALRGGSPRRLAIPESVRHEVWRRDEGSCVDCGSRENLEFDHIIPVSRGGSNTARNLELRCESCNRRKAATI